MSFFVLPPEANSALMYAGAGSGSFLDAAAAWDGVAADLGSAATDFSTVTSQLAGGAWHGPSAATMAAAAVPYTGWLKATSAAAEAAAAQARALAGAFEAALASTVDPAVIAENRAGLLSLALSNLFGQNFPAIAAAESDYERMWAQDVAAMAGYHIDASAVLSALEPFGPPVAFPAGSGGAGGTLTSLAASAETALLNAISGDFFPITLPLDVKLDGGIGPITIQSIRILPTIPLNFQQTFMLGPLAVPPINVPPSPSVGITIPIDIGPLKIPPITVLPPLNIAGQTVNIPGFNIAPGGITTSGILVGSITVAPVGFNLSVNPIAVQLGLSTPAVTLFPRGLSIPDNPIHLDVSVSAGTGGFTIPGFSLPERAVPLTISMAGQIDGFSTPTITVDRIPAHLHINVSADHVVPLFPLPNIPLTIAVDGSLGPINVHPIAVPPAHVSITDATVSLGSFTIPQITIPQIPVTATGNAALASSTISAIHVLDPLNITGQLTLPTVTGPSVSTGQVYIPLGGTNGPYVTIKSLTASLALVPHGSEVLNVGTTGLTLPNISIPSQTVAAIELTGAINPFTVFPGGLTFPENSVSLVDFSAGSDAFTIFPNGFRVDQFPFDIHATVLSPTPSTTGSIGPIHIPAVPAITPIHVGATGSVDLNLGVPSIPIPALSMGLTGNVHYGFVTSAPINIPALGSTGDLSTGQIDVQIKVGSFPLSFNLPVAAVTVSGNVSAFTITESIGPMSVPLNFTSPQITIPPIALGGSVPINLPLDILSPATIPGITHTQSIPINFGFNTEMINIPDTTIPAIAIGANSATPQVSSLFTGLATTLANAGPQVRTAVNAGLAWVEHQLMNAGLGNTGVYNLGNGNLGDLNFGDGNIGSYNLGGGNIGVGNVGWGNSGLGTLLGHNIGFGNSGAGNIGFGNSGNGNIGIGNSGNGNIGIGLSGDHQSGFGGWNSGSGNVGLFNSGSDNWGLFNSGSHNSGIGNSGQANTGLFNSGVFNTGLGNAGDHNMGFLNAGSSNIGAFNPGSLDKGLFNTGIADVGVANSGNVDIGVLISGNHSIGALFTGDYQGLAAPSLGINLLNINTNLGPVHIDPIHVAGLPITVNETFNVGPVTAPQVAVPPLTLDIHESLALPAVTLLPGMNLSAQTITIPINMSAGAASSLQLPVIQWTAMTKAGPIEFNQQQFFIGQSSNPTSSSGQPTQGIKIDFGASSAKTGSITVNLPAVHIPQIATSPLPLTVDVHGGVPAFTLFPGGLSIPENPIPVNVALSGGLQPFTIFPDGYTIDAVPLHLSLDASLVNPFDGIPPSLKLVQFHFYGDLGPVTLPDLPVPAISLGLDASLTHGAFTIPSIPIPNIPVDIAGSVDLGPIGIASQTIPAITGNPLLTIHFDQSQSGGMKVSPFYVWSPSNAPWDPVSFGPSFIAVGSGFSGAYSLPTGPLTIGGSTQNPFSVTVSGSTLAFNTPAVMIDKIPLNFDVHGGVDGATFFPNGLTFPANNLVDLHLSAGPGAFTIPATTIPAINADLNGTVSLRTPDTIFPPYKLLQLNVTGGVGPIVFPSFHIPPIPLGLNLSAGIGPITIPSFSTPAIHLGLDTNASAGPLNLEPINLPQLGAKLSVNVSDMTSGVSSTTGALRLSGVAGIPIDISSSGTGKIGAFIVLAPDGNPFTLLTPPGGGIPGVTIPVAPIQVDLPLSVTIPSLTFPGVTIPQIPLGGAVSGDLPAFDTPSITINRIPIDFSGPLTLL